jgi:hypothetical protein
MRIWPRTKRPNDDQEPPRGPETVTPAGEVPAEPTTEQVLEAGPALDWGGDPSRITG